MKILKKILIALAIILAIPLIVALFIEKDYAIVKETTINRPKDEVFAYIKYLRNQDHYSVWSKMDPNMKQTFEGVDGTVGFVNSWESDHDSVGKGSQRITKIEEGKRLEMKLQFKEPFEVENDAFMTTEAIDSSSTKVSWGFSGSFPYPMNIMRLFMDMEDAVGGDLQKGLANLKELLEKEN